MATKSDSENEFELAGDNIALLIMAIGWASVAIFVLLVCWAFLWASFQTFAWDSTAVFSNLLGNPKSSQDNDEEEKTEQIGWMAILCLELRQKIKKQVFETSLNELCSA